MVFGEDAEFRYFKGLSEASIPDTRIWRTIGFDDSAWPVGQGPFYYEDTAGFVGNTALTDMRGRYTCVYLRKAFDVPSPTAILDLSLAIQSDDGCIAWLNGVEVGRINMPDGDPAYDGTSLPPSGEPNTAVFAIANPSALLKPGRNVVAIQAFNGSLSDSSDFLISAALTSTADETVPTLVDTVPAPGATVGVLTQIEVTFSENVAGVEASDLLINGQPATSLKVYSPRNYAFDFAPPPTGRVSVTWTATADIVDLSSPPNRFAGGGWEYLVDPTAPPTDLIISEFLADNEHGLRDNFGERSDWIELLNRGAEAASLLNWSLTDERTQLGKWRFPNVTIPANGYLLVWASGRDLAQPSAPLHTSFKLTGSGEYLALVDPTGNIVSEFAPAYPAQQDDVSFGRDRTSPELTGYFAVPTPGVANGTSGSGFAPEPVFSRVGGVYVLSSFTLNITAPSGTIRYTTDGTTPTSNSPVFSAPLNFSASAVVQARVFQTGLLPSPIVVHTYNLLGTSVSGFSSNLPLLIVNTARRGIPQDQRIPAFVTAIETVRGRASPLTPPQFQGKAQIEIRGQSSTGFPKSAYNLELNDPSGLDLEVPLLGLPAESDWVLYNPYSDKPFLQNFLAFELHEKMGHYAPRRQFVEVFMDTNGGRLEYPGDYAGIYILLEKIKVDPQRVDIARLTPQQNAEPEITGGYIIKKDKDSPGDRNFGTQGGGGFGGQALKYHEPKPREITAAQQNWIRSYLNQFERSLYAPNWLSATGTNHYSHYIDVDSFVDNHWIVEFPKQIDGYRLSNYMSKDRGGKLRMEPIWDWNLSFGNADYLDGWRTDGWYWTLLDADAHIWLRRLICGTTYPSGTAGDPDFNQKIADRWSVLRTNILSATNLLARIDQLAASLNEAQARDFQKWPRLGSYVWPNPTMYVTPTTYAGIIAALKGWVQGRYNWIDAQFLKPPQLSSGDRAVSAGFPLTVSAPTGAIYYTIDGSDPRAPGGGLAPQARLYNAVVPITANSRVVARARVGTRWSGPVAATFVVDTPPLLITELMYHPPPPAAGSTNEPSRFEYLELKNAGPTPLDLRGFRFVDGIQFSFATSRITSLNPGARVLVVSHAAAFGLRYPDAAMVAGEYQGTLANEGERIRLVGPVEEVVQEFAYHPDWYPVTDGLGFALVAADEAQPPSAAQQQGGWRAGTTFLGTPGQSEPPPPTFPAVVVNEALTHADPPLLGSIEIANLGDQPADIGGWFLSDDRLTPKYRIPANTVIPPHGFLVVTEREFDPMPGTPPSFNLRAAGDEAYLFAADAAGQLTGYRHGFHFGAALNGVSFGRFVTSDGREHFVAQEARSLGAANGRPRVGPVVITEIMYRPPDVITNNASWDNPEDEYLELRNLSTAPVALYSLDAPTNTWRLRDAVRYTFPPGQTLAPGERILVVGFDPSAPAASAAFRNRYGLDPTLRLFGPYEGKLANDRNSVELVQPDLVRQYGTNDLATSVLVDQVAYADASPWPIAADGTGLSLQRVDATGYGNDPANWIAATPSPGAATPTGAAPVITRQPSPQAVPAGATVTLSVEASGSGNLKYQWRWNGENLANATASVLTLTNLQAAREGEYQAAVWNSAGSATSQAVTVRLTNPPLLIRQPQPFEVRAGETAELSVVASAASPLRYQWRKNGHLLPNATRSTLPFAPAQPAETGLYDVAVEAGLDSITSTPVSVRILGDPLIVQQPLGGVAAQGGTFTFGIAVHPVASRPIGYRWLRNGVSLQTRMLDAAVDFLTLTNLQPTDAGYYSVVVTNPGALAAGVTSQSARLEVLDLADTDQDGVPDSYERDHGMDPNDPADATQDADLDQAANGEEYLAGTDLRDPSSVLRVEQIALGDPVALRFQGVDNRSYTVLFRDRTVGSPWQTLLRIPPVSDVSTAVRMIDVVDPQAVSRDQRAYRIGTSGLSSP